MRKSALALSLLVAILVADAVDPLAAVLSIVTPGSIKAAREKSDREMKLDTKRPWDNMDLTGPHALENRPNPPER